MACFAEAETAPRLSGLGKRGHSELFASRAPGRRYLELTIPVDGPRARGPLSRRSRNCDKWSTFQWRAFL